MNLDLLKKLTRLANNNPNENEANSAARRVCKMLEEANWNLSNPRQETKIPGIQTPPSDPASDWFRKQSNQYADPFDMANEIREQIRREQKAYADRMKQAQEDFRKRSQNQYNPFTEGMWDKPPKQPKWIKCSKCGVNRHTTFVGTPSQFICQECAWTGI